MTVSVSTIAERALRRLGVSIVPLDDSPVMTEMVPVATIATMALVELGVIATGQVPPSQAANVPLATLATSALTRLGVIASDETPTASDMALAQNAVTEVHNALVAQGSVDWTTAGITTEVSEEYAALAAINLASSFGKQVDLAAVPPLEARIANTSRVSRAQALALDKVASVHAALDAQGVVWWNATAVPRAFVEEYTKLTASQAASSFGKQADPQMALLMEARVRKGAMEISGHDVAVEAVMAVHNNLLARGLARWSSQDIPDYVAPQYEVLAADWAAPKFDKQTDPNDLVLAMRQLAQIIALPTSGNAVQGQYF